MIYKSTPIVILSLLFSMVVSLKYKPLRDPIRTNPFCINEVYDGFLEFMSGEAEFGFLREHGNKASQQEPDFFRVKDFKPWVEGKVYRPSDLDTDNSQRSESFEDLVEPVKVRPLINPANLFYHPGIYDSNDDPNPVDKDGKPIVCPQVVSSCCHESEFKFVESEVDYRKSEFLRKIIKLSEVLEQMKENSALIAELVKKGNQECKSGLQSLFVRKYSDPVNITSFLVLMLSQLDLLADDYTTLFENYHCFVCDYRFKRFRLDLSYGKPLVTVIEFESLKKFWNLFEAKTSFSEKFLELAEITQVVGCTEKKVLNVNAENIKESLADINKCLDAGVESYKVDKKCLEFELQFPKLGDFPILNDALALSDELKDAVETKIEKSKASLIDIDGSGNIRDNKKSEDEVKQYKKDPFDDFFYF